jgi:hypothetical protein
MKTAYDPRSNTTVEHGIPSLCTAGDWGGVCFIRAVCVTTFSLEKEKKNMFVAVESNGDHTRFSYSIRFCLIPEETVETHSVMVDEKVHTCHLNLPNALGIIVS